MTDYLSDIDINKKTVEEMITLIEEASKETVEENIKDPWEMLQNAARNFLEGYKYLEQNAKNLDSQILKTIHTITPDNAPIKTKSIKQQQLQILQMQYLLAIKFDEYLKIYRNEAKSIMVYIYEDSNGKLTPYELNMRELVFGSFFDEHKGTLRFGEGGSINYLKHLQSQESNKLKPFIDDDHMKEAQSVYNWTEQRYQRHFEVVKHSMKNDAILMWKENREWVLSTVKNLGDIKEAFTGYLLSNHINEICKSAMPVNSPPDKYGYHASVKLFFENYISKVSNLEAIIEEDIQVKNKENEVVLQLGIKSGKATLPGISQYLKTAYAILKDKNLKEDIDNWFKNNFNRPDFRNKIITSLEDVGKKVAPFVQELFAKRNKMHFKYPISFS